jgi:eukaryotic-like serine/threonine-protein kinase
MALTAATRLGPYEILGLIGAGGMGEVYKATDTRLDRTVAIKVLASHLTDLEHRARFEREARIIAGLSHPHICSLYDVGEHGSSQFLVMEYLEGCTLAERLRKGALPIAEALEIGVQTAEALAAAHRAGFIHRDLKPGNIMLTKSGVKLLDFGLAKLQSSGTTMESVTMSALPTHEPATLVGTVLGTLPYMAPEQLEGKEADARSDIFSFGAVLYEMLTGKRAFQGESSASIIAAILGNGRPSPLLQRSGIPVALDRFVATCLAKDPAERWQSARDIALHLVAPLAATPAASAARRPGATWAIAVMFTLGAVGGALAGLGLRRNTVRAPASPLTRLSFPLPPGTLLAPNHSPGAGASVAISPDGRSVAFVARRGDLRTLEIHSLESGLAKTLAGTEGAMSPLFSPDGHWVAFFTKNGLKKVSIDDGTITTICQTPPVTRGAVWASDGSIYFSPDFSRGLQRVRAAGGVPQDLTQVRFDVGESNHLLPEVLPGGETVLFTVWKGGSFKDASVWSLSLRTGERKHLVDSATAPRYVPPGYLAFAREAVLFAVPFDPVRAVLTGEVFPVVDGVWTDPTTGSAHYAVGQDGTLVFAAGRNTAEQVRLVWVDREGHISPTQAEPNAYGTVRLSPDGERVALELLNDIWVYDLKTGAMSRVTHRSVNQFPVWTPDGRRIAIGSSQGVLLPTLFSIPSEGGQLAARLSDEGSVQFPGSWAPDGRRLAYASLREGADSGWDIQILDLDSRPAHSSLVATPFTDDTPMISPDGRALAYVSDETGRRQVYLRPFPGEGTRLQVSTDGGTEPVWSRSGGELFFRNGRRMLAVRVRTQERLAIDRPAVLFEADFAVTSGIPETPSYDVAPDGRFLMVARSGEQSLPRQLEVVLNWITELDRRSPQRTP